MLRSSMTGYRVSSELLLMKMKRRGVRRRKQNDQNIPNNRLNILPVDHSLRTVCVSVNSFQKWRNVWKIEYLLVTQIITKTWTRLSWPDLGPKEPHLPKLHTLALCSACREERERWPFLPPAYLYFVFSMTHGISLHANHVTWVGEDLVDNMSH